MNRIQLKLSPKEEEALQNQERRAQDGEEALRCRAVLLVSRGYPTEEVAALLDRAVETIRRAVRRFRKGGAEGLKTKERPGRPRTVVTAEVKERLATVIRQAPRAAVPFDSEFSLSTWTGKLLVRYLEKVERWPMSETSVRRALLEQGISLGRPKYRLTSPDEDYPEKATTVEVLKKVSRGRSEEISESQWQTAGEKTGPSSPGDRGGRSAVCRSDTFAAVPDALSGLSPAGPAAEGLYPRQEQAADDLWSRGLWEWASDLPDPAERA